MSPVKANAPLPTLSAVKGSGAVTTGLWRWTMVLRSSFIAVAGAGAGAAMIGSGSIAIRAALLESLRSSRRLRFMG